MGEDHVRERRATGIMINFLALFMRTFDPDSPRSICIIYVVAKNLSRVLDMPCVDACGELICTWMTLDGKETGGRGRGESRGN